MTPDLKISLVIPAHNEEKRIGECLDRAMKNSGGRFFEIIVIDNASTDRTAEIAGRMPGVRVVREENKGLTHARERGFKEARGDILAYIDADTLMPSGWIGRVMGEFARDSDTVCVSGPYHYYDIPRAEQFLNNLYWLFIAKPMYWIVDYMAVGGNFAIKKETLQKMGGFDTTIAFYGEDTNIARRASRFGKVKFKLHVIMNTSGRRFRGQGLWSTAFTYMINFASEAFLHKPSTREYRDIR